jgi:uncharacterized SAM-binding protein YcdF (DUF218 family)
MLLLMPIEVKQYTNHQCDIAIVLGGKDDYDRVLKGLEIAKKFNSGLIFSGVNSKYKDVVEKFDFQHIIFDDISTNTYENMLQSKIFLNHTDNICLVTSEAHMYRVIKIFEKVGIQAYPIISNEVNFNLNIKDFLPDLKYLVLNVSVFYEYLAWIEYKVLKRI